MSKRHIQYKKGSTLVEILISLSLFLIIIISSLEFFIAVKNHFFTLKKYQELEISAWTALDKMRIDFTDSGLGLLIPQKLDVLKCVEFDGDMITVRRKDRDLSLSNDLISGSTRIALHSTAGIKKGQELSIHDRQKGETAEVMSVDREGVILSAPLSFSYNQLTAQVFSVKKISFYLDQKGRVLRRKVNSSPAQPLLEEVDSVEFSYDDASNLINVSLKTTEERTYEISVFPKNLDLASPKKTE